MDEIKYVAHICANSLKKEKDKDYCNNIWIDKDELDVYVNPPVYKYCEDCIKKALKTIRKLKINTNLL